MDKVSHIVIYLDADFPVFCLCAFSIGTDINRIIGRILLNIQVEIAGSVRLRLHLHARGNRRHGSCHGNQ